MPGPTGLELGFGQSAHAVTGHLSFTPSTWAAFDKCFPKPGGFSVVTSHRTVQSSQNAVREPLTEKAPLACVATSTFGTGGSRGADPGPRQTAQDA